MYWPISRMGSVSSGGGQKASHSLQRLSAGTNVRTMSPTNSRALRPGPRPTCAENLERLAATQGNQVPELLDVQMFTKLQSDRTLAAAANSGKMSMSIVIDYHDDLSSLGSSAPSPFPRNPPVQRATTSCVSRSSLHVCSGDDEAYDGRSDYRARSRYTRLDPGTSANPFCSPKSCRSGSSNKVVFSKNC